MKKGISILLSILIIIGLFSGIPFSVSATEDESILVGASSGTTGDCTWTLDDEGTLTISGNGAMKDDYHPWGTRIKNINIEKGVTNIGISAFSSCSNLTSVSLSNSITSIGAHAFNFCSNLASITIPDSVASIGEGAFNNTAWYDNQPDGLVYAGKVAYKYKGTMPDNTSIVLKEGTKGIVATSFYNCEGLTNMTIPDSVTSIGELAFSGCTSLTNITIPDSVTIIGDSAFQYCINLTNITIPDSVTSIGNNTFNNCISLTNITIPDSVTSIGSGSFSGCTSLTNVTIPDSVTSIGWEAFFRCTSLTNITIPNSVTSIGNRAFSNTTWYDNQPDGLVYVGKFVYVYKGEIPANSSIVINDGTKGIAGSAFSSCTGLTSITIPNSVSNIGERAFFGCTSLTSITIPDSVTSIGSEAFYGCKILARVTISDSVTSIGSSTFSGCTSLTNITIPDSVTIIGDSAFQYCINLTNITISDSVTSIGSNAFQGCTSLTSITIGNSVMNIGDYAFENCTNLTTIVVNDGNPIYDSRNNCNAIIVTENNTMIAGCKSTIIPNSVTSIGNDAFRSCAELTSIMIPNSVTSIGYGAFFDCTSLTSITIPDSVTSIGSVAFGNTAYYNNEDNWENGVLYLHNVLLKANNQITGSYRIKNGTVIIADSAFVGCNKLEHVTIPDTVTTIGVEAFCFCLGGLSIDIPNSVTKIGECAFERTPLKSIVIPDSIKTIEAGTFADCYITDLYIPRSVKTIKNAFFAAEWAQYTQELIKNVYYSGSKSEWDDIDIYDSNSSLFLASIHFDISACSISLNQDMYTFTGEEIRPEIVVKDGTTTLINGTDYSVNYPNAVNAGTYTISITGKGKYTGYTSKTFKIVNPKQQFVWGQDNWNFLNSAPTYFPSSTYRNQINSTYASKLKSNLTNSEYQVIFGGSWYSDAWLDDRWGGSCYGMSSLAFLSMNDLLPYSNYKSSATKLHDLGYPKNNTNQLSLITYYQMIQVKGVIQQQYRTVPNKSHKENITNLINLLDKNSTVLVGFKKAGWGGHAILATGYEYGSWTFNGVSYQGCIKICDPNASTNYNTRYNIYFNTNSYNWTIPGYTNMTSTAGAKFNYIGANVNEINNGGYLSGTANSTVDDYVARIDAYAISDDRSVSKVVESNGVYMNKSSQPGEIVEDYSYILGNESEGTIGYNLYDSSSSYKVSQDNAERLQLSMDYENCLLSGGSAAGSSVIFDKSGYVEVNGESAMYNISETFDDSYSTDWFTIQAQGYNANKASLRMVDDGYVLTADKLENVTLKANNREHTARTAFSTNYTSVFIYEIDEDTIGLKIDTDNNGTYETELSANEDSTEIGDVNGDNSIDVLDATVIQKYTVDKTTLTDNQKDVADVNDDGVVDILDATLIQKYAVDKITEFKKK